MDSGKSIKSNTDFRRIYSKGKNAVTPFLVIYCMKNREGSSRVGFTVSAKLGNAVKRNRVRRQFREIYRLNEGRIIPGYDMIVVARSRAIDCRYSLLENAFCEALSSLKLIVRE